MLTGTTNIILTAPHGGSVRDPNIAYRDAGCWNPTIKPVCLFTTVKPYNCRKITKGKYLLFFSVKGPIITQKSRPRFEIFIWKNLSGYLVIYAWFYITCE